MMKIIPLSCDKQYLIFILRKLAKVVFILETKYFQHNYCTVGKNIFLQSYFISTNSHFIAMLYQNGLQFFKLCKLDSFHLFS